MYLIGFIILLVATLIQTFLQLGRLIIAKLTKVKTLKIFGNSKWPVRIGYMGAGMILAAHWTLEPLLFIAGFSCVLIQVLYRKQWNLVALNINGLVAWIIHFLK
jgi:ABC-type lipoprotein release transport system permease subunit